MLNYIHSILISLLIFSNISVLFSQNPVYSVLFMILSFVASSMILFLFKIDFLALLYIIIYVGALAILFLFIIMMLNAKYSILYKSNFYLIILLSSSIFTLVLLYIFFNEIFSNFLSYTFDTILNSDFFNNINSFGQIFFNYYLTIILTAGLILLLALVSSISLTINQT